MAGDEVGKPTRGRLRSGLASAALVLVGALVLGGATSYLQTLLPPALSSFANSAGGWTMLAFVLVWFSRARVALAAVLGVVAFEALVEGYGLVSGWRGYFYARPFSGVYSLIGLAAGPLVGATAGVTRHLVGPWRALAMSPLCAVLIGEGAYGLVVIGETTSPIYWVLQIVLGLSFFVLGAVRSAAGRLWVVLGAGLSAVGALSFFGLLVRL